MFLNTKIHLYIENLTIIKSIIINFTLMNRNLQWHTKSTLDRLQELLLMNFG